MQLLWLILLAALASCATRQPSEASSTQTPPPSSKSATPVPPAATPVISAPDAAPEQPIQTTINDRFLDPNLDVERWKKNFEGESREVYAAREEVVAALDIKPGQSVADIGAGTGFYLWKFSESVGPSGRVYGVEISPRFLDRLRIDAKKYSNSIIVTGAERSIELPPDSVDLVFICDTYHHFEYPQTMLASIRRALRPGGSLVIIDFHRIEGKSSDWTLRHVRGGESVFQSEIEAAGFEFGERLDISGFTDNYMIRFRVGE